MSDDVGGYKWDIELTHTHLRSVAGRARISLPRILRRFQKMPTDFSLKSEEGNQSAGLHSWGAEVLINACTWPDVRFEPLRSGHSADRLRCPFSAKRCPTGMLFPPFLTYEETAADVEIS
jgi:hypothetical protein